MDATELQQWLTEHIDDIVSFMDYEPTIDSEEELATTFGYWFGSENWKQAGYRFVHLGIDGMGSQFAAWVRPNVDGPPPVVYFGSEGGRGVMAKSPEDWAKILAHAPGIDEYPSEDGPATLSPEANWMLQEEDSEEARAALENYRSAVTQKLGEIPTLDVLTSGLDALNGEFMTWVAESVQAG